DARFKTYGCGSAIASSSLVTEWVRGKTLDEALDIKNTHIAEELALPPVKIHCSILAEDAIKAAVNDYKTKHASCTKHLGVLHQRARQRSSRGDRIGRREHVGGFDRCCCTPHHTLLDPPGQGRGRTPGCEDHRMLGLGL